MAGSRGRGRGQAGRGIIGFLVALIVVGYGGYALWATYQVKHKKDVLNDYAYEVLGQAERAKWTPDDVRFQVVKKAKEVGVALREQDVDVAKEPTRWSIRFAWDDTVVIPGYSRKLHFEVRHDWTRF